MNNSSNTVTPWGEIGYLVYKRTYSRTTDEKKKETEEFEDTVERVIKACRTQLKVGFTKEEEDSFRKYLLSLKGIVAGRFLWQLGTKTVSTLGLPSLQNCFSGDTVILTDSGPFTLEALVGKQFKVFAKGEWHDAEAKSFGVQKLNRYVFEVQGRSNHTLSFVATENHRWELESGSVTEGLSIGDKVVSQGIELEEDLDGFRHGLVFGDGSLSYKYKDGDNSFCIRLCGLKEKYKDLFDKYHYQPNCGGDPVAYIRTKEDFKDFPRNKDAKYIGSFIKGWMAADGSTSPAGSIIISSQNEKAYEYLSENAPYSGFVVSGVSYSDNETNFGKRSSPLCKITLTKSKTFVVKEIHPLDEDEVFCAVVPGVERFTLAGGLLTCNCAFCTVDSPIRPFTWAMDLLMLGCGVGFNIQRENVYQLPKLQKKKVKIERWDNSQADYIVPDTREGWVKLLGKVLKSYFYSGEGFTYSTQLVRGKGAPITGFGGVASGPEVLVEGIGYICDILDKRRGDRLRPIDCLDIMCIIGMIVVAGNVRRSALIAIGDCDDIEYLQAKRWDLGTLPKWRSNSNNSVVCEDISKLPDEFWNGYNGKGEPYGLINLKLSRSCGRLGETQYPDPNVQGFNPLTIAA